MKIKLIIINILMGVTLYGQSPIYPVFQNSTLRNVQGAWYKDINGDYNSYIGIWKYENNGVVFTLKLEKMLQYFDPEYLTYEDFVVGEYRYVVNNVEKINTLSNFNLGLTNPYRYNLFGSAINTAENFPECSSCQPFEKRLLMMFNDPSLTNIEGLSGQLIIRRLVNSTPPKIEVWLKQEGNIYYEAGSPQPVDAFTIPWGTYVLTKVE